MSEESRFYVAFYSAAIAGALTLSDDALRVLLSLSTHINEQGVCWPSVRAVSAQVQRPENAVVAAIDELHRANYVRPLAMYKTDGEVVDALVLSPYLIHVAQPHMGEALRRWNAATRAKPE